MDNQYRLQISCDKSGTVEYTVLSRDELNAVRSALDLKRSFEGTARWEKVALDDVVDALDSFTEELRLAAARGQQ